MKRPKMNHGLEHIRMTALINLPTNLDSAVFGAPQRIHSSSPTTLYENDSTKLVRCQFVCLRLAAKAEKQHVSHDPSKRRFHEHQDYVRPSSPSKLT